MQFQKYTYNVIYIKMSSFVNGQNTDLISNRNLHKHEQEMLYDYLPQKHNSTTRIAQWAWIELLRQVSISTGDVTLALILVY